MKTLRFVINCNSIEEAIRILEAEKDDEDFQRAIDAAHGYEEMDTRWGHVEIEDY